MFCRAVQDVWSKCESACALSASTPVVFLNMADKAQTETGLERDLIRRIAEAEYHVMLLGTFLRCAQYGLLERLAFPRMMSGYGGCGA